MSRHIAFYELRDNQVLEMRSAALQNAVAGLEAVVQRLRSERDALCAELERLRAEMTRSQRDAFPTVHGSEECHLLSTSPPSPIMIRWCKPKNVLQFVKKYVILTLRKL